ncbi:MAG: FkbM family methyltransferase [Verrucomicrobia subdivision 3 bacterium]|nr:FkbM family methyltransferase [Limisphaerales bacterium]
MLPSEIRIGSNNLRLHLPEDGGTRTAFIDVLLDDCYHIWDLPDAVQSVADIGCHAGLFAIAARERWSRAIIHAYEPNVALKTCYEQHAAQANFKVYPEAVGLSSGTVALIPDPESVQVRTAEAKNGGIPQVAFREVLARLGGSADVVKLDCEGAEWEILQDDVSWQQVRLLTMEFHLWAGYTLEELKSRVARIGFRIRCCDVTGPDFGLLLAERRG